jgi:septal ring factor EnvC (AmiA/AmiB activator)
MNKQAEIPDLETRQRHIKNAQSACQELQAFTAALDDLIAQLEAEIAHQPRSAKRSPNFEGAEPSMQ